MDDFNARTILLDDEHGFNPPESKTGSSTSFTFVPITGQEAASRKINARYTVRHHVTRIQHAKARYTRTSNLLPWQVNPFGLLSANDNKSSRSANRKDAGNVTPTAIKNHQVREIHRDIVSMTSSFPTLPVEQLSASSSSRRSYNIALPSPQNLTVGCSDLDPFWTLPIAYSSFIPPIIAHYIQNIAVEDDDLDDDDEKGLVRKRFVPLVMDSAATMYGVLVMAASHHASVSPSVGKEAKVQILYLKSMALEEINKALTAHDVTKPPDDAMIGAVMKMAAYEAVFGDSDVFELHLHGLARMIEARGGLDALGLNGLLERMVLWIDLNGAHLTGKPRIIGDNAKLPTTVSFDAPNPVNFTGGIH